MYKRQDFDAYKNMVGAFHMPRLVYTNLATLKTLDGEQMCIRDSNIPIRSIPNKGLY